MPKKIKATKEKEVKEVKKVGKVAKKGLEQRCNKHAAAAAHRIRQVDGHHARIMLTASMLM